MNLADLSSILSMLIVAIGIPSAASSEGAPLWVVFITVPVAIGFGILFAFANRRIMYRLLGATRRNEKKSEGNLFLYMIWPVAWLPASIAASIAIGLFAASLIQK